MSRSRSESLSKTINDCGLRSSAKKSLNSKYSTLASYSPQFERKIKNCKSYHLFDDEQTLNSSKIVNSNERSNNIKTETLTIIYKSTENLNDEEIDNEPQQSSIQVAVRMRPFLPKENKNSDNSEIRLKNNKVLLKIERNSAMNDTRSTLKVFEFNHVFDSSDYDKINFISQEKAFRIIGEPILKYSLRGYNTCLFAYGQSGSGKTFTMMGTETNPGIIPRLLLELFKNIYEKKNYDITTTISFLEIYQEKLYDLLGDDFDGINNLRVRENPEMGIHIPNLTMTQVKDYKEAMEVLNFGNEKRKKSETKLNVESSRSHAVFTITIVQKSLSEIINGDNGDAYQDNGNTSEEGNDIANTLVSKIHLVDLAGSEKPSENDSQRFREGTAINKSLFTLRKVIDSLAKDNECQVIPYRESQLTFLLKDSLGGNSRTFMIANISPCKDNIEETLSTLRYASTASKIVNTVRVNQDPTSGYINSLLREISFLKKQLSPQKNSFYDCESLKSKKILSFETSEKKSEQPRISPVFSESSVPDSETEEKLLKTSLILKKSLENFEQKTIELKKFSKEFNSTYENNDSSFHFPSFNKPLTKLQNLLEEMKDFRVEDYSPDYDSYLKELEVDPI